MVAYSFKSRFAAPILAGTKRQTIRADRKRHARVGEEVQLYTGMRTKHCKLIGRAHCLRVQCITLHFRFAGRVTTLDGDIKGHDLFDFARRDGFKDWDDMKSFWKTEHPDLDTWDGMLIEWGPLLSVSGEPVAA